MPTSDELTALINSISDTVSQEVLQYFKLSDASSQCLRDPIYLKNEIEDATKQMEFMKMKIDLYKALLDCVQRSSLPNNEHSSLKTTSSCPDNTVDSTSKSIVPSSDDKENKSPGSTQDEVESSIPKVPIHHRNTIMMNIKSLQNPALPFDGTQKYFEAFWMFFGRKVHNNPTFNSMKKLLLLRRFVEGAAATILSEVEQSAQDYNKIITDFYRHYKPLSASNISTEKKPLMCYEKSQKAVNANCPSTALPLCTEAQKQPTAEKSSEPELGQKDQNETQKHAELHAKQSRNREPQLDSIINSRKPVSSVAPRVAYQCTLKDSERPLSKKTKPNQSKSHSSPKSKINSTRVGKHPRITSIEKTSGKEVRSSKRRRVSPFKTVTRNASLPSLMDEHFQSKQPSNLDYNRQFAPMLQDPRPIIEYNSVYPGDIHYEPTYAPSNGSQFVSSSSNHGSFFPSCPNNNNLQLSIGNFQPSDSPPPLNFFNSRFNPEPSYRPSSPIFDHDRSSSRGSSYNYSSVCGNNYNYNPVCENNTSSIPNDNYCGRRGVLESSEKIDAWNRAWQMYNRSANKRGPSSTCAYCNCFGSHSSAFCSVYTLNSEREALVKLFRLCRQCLSGKHHACSARCNDCGDSHHLSLCRGERFKKGFLSLYKRVRHFYLKERPNRR